MSRPRMLLLHRFLVRENLRQQLSTSELDSGKNRLPNGIIRCFELVAITDILQAARRLLRDHALQFRSLEFALEQITFRWRPLLGN